MNFRQLQAPASGVMVRPHKFTVNPQTAADNVFQGLPPDIPAEELAQRALNEFDAAVDALFAAGVHIHVFDDYGEKDTPDSVFPNNWFSTHHGGRVAVYPMYPPNRRRERRSDVIEMLKSAYRVQEVVDYSGLELDNLFLEGTGAMVFDHLERLAYVCHSNRANPIILERFCTTFGYEPMAFECTHMLGQPIYHTNVMMCIATEYTLICLDLIADPERREEIALRLENSGRTIVNISRDQVTSFAGNAMEMTGRDGRVLALSSKAADAMTSQQVVAIEKCAKLLPLEIPTIELAGGSVRCMIAGVHLTER